MLKQITEELLQAYTDLRRYLTRELRNAEDAADVAQSSFERTLVHVAANPVTSPRALLFRTAQNLCIDRARHQKIVRGWANERSALDAELCAPSAEHVVAQLQLVRRVAAQLEALPPRRREIFLLFRVYGHSRQDIALQLGISEAAVAKHLVRATLDCARVFAALRED
jgi:RNA polymerase sigma-70 factor (ECF subfamily)